MNRSIPLYVEDIPKMVFQEWNIETNKNTIVVKPIYREFNFAENASYFFNNLFR